jgi:coproporphyrinogen III oxidase-like Fe-S oxidoreductase
LTDAYGAEVEDLIRLGLLEKNGDVTKLTRRGRLLGNQVFVRFV